jgi:hypothetical protein
MRLQVPEAQTLLPMRSSSVARRERRLSGNVAWQRATIMRFRSPVRSTSTSESRRDPATSASMLALMSARSSSLGSVPLA